MYRIIISGKTPGELHQRIAQYLKEVNYDQIKVEQVSQPDIAFSIKRIEPLPIEPQEPSFESVPIVAPPPFIAPAIPLPIAPVAPSHAIGERDSNGIPWDERIHASSQTKNKDGTWRTRRGVEPDAVKQIETSLRTGAAPAPIFNPPPIAQPIVQPVVVATPVEAAPVVTGFPDISSAPMHSLDTFKNNLVPLLAKLVADQKLTNDYLGTLKAFFGVEQIWLVNDSQLTQMFEEFVKSGLIIRAV